MCEKQYFRKVHYDHFRPITDYCYWQGKAVVDKILVLERIDEDLAKISRRIQLHSMLTMNSSNPDIKLFFTTKNIDRVYSLYRDDKELHDAMLGK